MSLRISYQADTMRRDSHQPPPVTPGPEIIGLFKDILGRGVSLRVRVTGRSMAPFLRGGEIVTIRNVPGASLRRGDLILFMHPAGTPKIHRIIKKTRLLTGSFSFVTKGDALAGYDKPVRDSDILGKVCAIERVHPGAGAEYIDMESLRWRAASRLAAIAQVLKTEGYSPALRLSRFIGRIHPCKRHIV